MNIIDGAVSRPHTVLVIMLLCVIFGTLSLQTIPVQLKPSLDNPEIQIQTNYRGASPYEIEDQITRRIEEEMDGVEGINRVTSTSFDGSSQVKLEFDWGVDKDTALIDVISKLNQVDGFPAEANAPVPMSVTSESSEPTMWIVTRSNSMVPNQMFQLVEDIVEPQLRRIGGVGDMWVFGGEEREMQIRLDPAALVSRQVTLGELMHALRSENMNVRGGFFDEGKRRYTLRTVGQFSEMDDVLNIIVKRTPQGSVYLKEVATVEAGFKKRLSRVHANAEPTVVMGILRKSGANVVELSQAVKARLEVLNLEFAQKGIDMRMEVAYTDEEYINESVDLAWRNLGLGALLACMVLLIYLRSWRALIVVATTIPICIITVFIFMKGFGRSLNIISLAGLAFSSGMIVDSSIVVIENIYRHLEMGKRGLHAARHATREVWGAILISTLTTLAVFLPVIFIEEEAGQLFKDIAIAICLAISLSLMAAVTIIPMMAARLAKGSHEKAERAVSRRRALAYGALNIITFKWVGTGVSRGYQGVMHWLIGRSFLRILAKLAIVTGVVALFLWSLQLLPPAEYLPSGNRNLILIFATPLVGSNLDKSVESIGPLEHQLVNDPRVARTFAVFGTRFNAVGVIVKQEHASEQQMQQFVGELFGRARGITGFESLFPIQASIFRSPAKQIEIDIIGPSLETLQQSAAMMQRQLFGVEGVQFVRSSYSDGAPEVQVHLNRERSAHVGLRVNDVADIVESLVAGKVVGVFSDKGKQIDLTLYAQEGVIESRADLHHVNIYTPSGDIVNLSSVVDIRTTTGPTSINHVEKERAITLTVNLTPESSLQEMIETIDAQVLMPARQALPQNYFVRLAGTADKLDSTIRAMTGSFLLAILIVYLLMVALFRSWIYPTIILVTIPMAMSGAFFGIWAAHRLRDGLVAFDVIAMLGLIILAGIVVNNAILIVHQALNFREEGMDMDTALRASCDSRLRPICMSVTTTVLGMLPLAIGTGSGTELYRGLGAVVIGGLAVSTLFTLFLVPALFSLVQDAQITLARMTGRGVTALPSTSHSDAPGDGPAA